MLQGYNTEAVFLETQACGFVWSGIYRRQPCHRMLIRPASHLAQEYNTEAAFSASVLLSCLALLTLGVKEILELQASKETDK